MFFWTRVSELIKETRAKFTVWFQEYWVSGWDTQYSFDAADQIQNEYNH